MNDFTVVNFFVIFAMSVSADVPPRFSSRFSSSQQVERVPNQAFSPPSFRYTAPVPHSVYGPPPQEYGPPTEESNSTEGLTTELPTTTEQVNFVPGEGRNQKLTEGEDSSGNEEEGVYYIYHPDGRLQKVKYATKDDQRQMAFSANLKYENIEPISGPIYTYDPDTFEWSKIN